MKSTGGEGNEEKHYVQRYPGQGEGYQHFLSRKLPEDFLKYVVAPRPESR